MMKYRNVLFIRPRDCRYCINGYLGLKHSLDYAKDKGYNIRDLAWMNAEREPVESTVPIFQPFLIDGFGHGNIGVYTGNSETPIFSIAMDLSYLASSVIYLLSCLTANILGPYFIDEGVLGYGGFLISWTWMVDKGTDTDPYTDKYAHGFYESSNEFFNSLLDTTTLQEAYNRSYQKYNDWISYWTSGEGSDDSQASNAIKWLLYDRDGLVIYGDSSIRTKECHEIIDRNECMDNYCWWYEGKCHCESPSDIQATEDLHIKVKLVYAKGHIKNILCRVETYTDIPISLKLAIGNKGKKDETIWIKVTNATNGDIIFQKDEHIRLWETYHYTVNFELTEDSNILVEAGHYE